MLQIQYRHGGNQTSMCNLYIVGESLNILVINELGCTWNSIPDHEDYGNGFYFDQSGYPGGYIDTSGVEIGQSVIVSLTVDDVSPFSPTYPDTPSGTYTVSNIFNTGDDLFIQVSEPVILAFGTFAGGSITIGG